MKIRRLKNNVNEKKFANGLEVYDVQNDLSSYLFICFFFLFLVLSDYVLNT